MCLYLFGSCSFEGTHDELKAHLDKCKFEGLKGFLSRTDDHLEELQEELKRKDEEIMFLRSMLASLSEKVDHMEKTAVTKIGECWDGEGRRGGGEGEREMEGKVREKGREREREREREGERERDDTQISVLINIS